MSTDWNSVTYFFLQREKKEKNEFFSLWKTCFCDAVGIIIVSVCEAAALLLLLLPWTLTLLLLLLPILWLPAKLLLLLWVTTSYKKHLNEELYCQHLSLFAPQPFLLLHRLWTLRQKTDHEPLTKTKTSHLAATTAHPRHGK